MSAILYKDCGIEHQLIHKLYLIKNTQRFMNETMSSLLVFSFHKIREQNKKLIKYFL